MEQAGKKPSCLGLLNAIALGEGRAHQYLSCWAAKITDPDVKNVIATVAIREGEHSHAFTKRLCELGYTVQDRPDPGFQKNMEIANADCTDLEKFEALGFGRGSEERERDIFKGILDDQTIDPQTGALLGRYVAEERDSGRMLRACYNVLRERAGRGPRMSAPAQSELRELHGRLDEICAAIGKLQTEVTALRR